MNDREPALGREPPAPILRAFSVHIQPIPPPRPPCPDLHRCPYALRLAESLRWAVLAGEYAVSPEGLLRGVAILSARMGVVALLLLLPAYLGAWLLAAICLLLATAALAALQATVCLAGTVTIIRWLLRTPRRGR